MLSVDAADSQGFIRKSHSSFRISVLGLPVPWEDGELPGLLRGLMKVKTGN